MSDPKVWDEVLVRGQITRIEGGAMQIRLHGLGVPVMTVVAAELDHYGRNVFAAAPQTGNGPLTPDMVDEALITVTGKRFHQSVREGIAKFLNGGWPDEVIPVAAPTGREGLRAIPNEGQLAKEFLENNEPSVEELVQFMRRIVALASEIQPDEIAFQSGRLAGLAEGKQICERFHGAATSSSARKLREVLEQHEYLNGGCLCRNFKLPIYGKAELDAFREGKGWLCDIRWHYWLKHLMEALAGGTGERVPESAQQVPAQGTDCAYDPTTLCFDLKHCKESGVCQHPLYKEKQLSRTGRLIWSLGEKAKELVEGMRRRVKRDPDAADYRAGFTPIILEAMAPPQVQSEPPQGYYIKTFEEWFDLWDCTKDPEVRRLCKIAWDVAREKAIQPAAAEERKLP